MTYNELLIRPGAPNKQPQQTLPVLLAELFMGDVASRLANRVQMTTPTTTFLLSGVNSTIAFLWEVIHVNFGSEEIAGAQI